MQTFVKLEQIACQPDILARMLGARTVGLGEEGCNHVVERRIQARDNPIFWAKLSISVSYYRERRPRAEDAPALVDKAIKLSPLDPDLGRFYWIMGRAYFTQGKYDKAIENLQQSIQLSPPLGSSEHN